MNILITAPSLDSAKNVSGIGTIVNSIIQHNMEHHYFHYLLGRPDKPLNKLLWFLQLAKQLVLFPLALKRNKVELVHQNLPFDAKGVLREYVINFWCNLMGIPVVLHVHGGLFMSEGTKNIFFRKLSISLFQKSKNVIVLSEIERNVLKENFAYPSAIVLPNSIDVSMFSDTSIRQIEDKPSLLFLGRIEKNKGINELIEALKRLKNDFQFRFILCGTGALLQYFIEECNKNFGSDFEYKGVVSGEEKNVIIKQSDLFILPSYFEGLPMSLLETMAGGVVPIVTNVGSMKEIIKHGVNGLHIEKQNSNDLYEKLKYILSNPNQYQKLSINAKSTIRENYDIENYIVKLNKIYLNR
jgi:glycosyltransferase involved in cell wall biosynthesis